MGVLRQLLKEFCLPFLVASAWVALNYDGDLKKSATLFGGTFFFISWLTGQIFRVKKQNANEASLGAIRKDIEGLLLDLKEKTEDLIGHVNGGASFCMLMLPFGDSGSCRMAVLMNMGDYPLHDLTVRICDMNIFDSFVKTGAGNIDDANTYLPKIPLLLAQQGYPIKVALKIGSSDRYGFNIFYQARNGKFTQEIRGVKIAGDWIQATRIIRSQDGKVLYQELPESFPLDEDGEAFW